MTLVSVISILIFGACLWYLAGPLVAPLREASRRASSELSGLHLKKAEVLLDIKELELDYALKKLSERDYQELYDEAMAEGVEVLKRLEDQGSDLGCDNTPGIAGVSYCHACGARLVSQASYCSQCGVKVGGG